MEYRFFLMYAFTRIRPSESYYSVSPFFFFFFPPDLPIRLCRPDTRENNERDADAVSLKTAHSGVKFKILISKKPIQFWTSRITGYNTSFLRVHVFSFLSFYFAHRAYRGRKSDCSKASNVSINAVARSLLTIASFLFVTLCIFMRKFLPTYKFLLNICISALTIHHFRHMLLEKNVKLYALRFQKYFENK